jgi:hypothetical protein
MRKLWLTGGLMLSCIIMAACSGSTTTTAVPTSNPNAVVTVEDTTPNAAEAANGTAVLEPAFSIQVSGDTDVNIASDAGGEVSDMLAGANTGAAGGAENTGQSVQNTPSSELRTLRFTDANQVNILEVTFSDGLAPDQYQIGVDNVNTTVGNNANEDSSGASTTDGSSASGSATMTPQARPPTDVGTAQVGPSATPAIASGNNTQAAQGSTANGQNQDNTLSDNNPPPQTSDLGISERDESLPPTISARLEPSSGNGTSYNLLQSGTLTIASMNKTSVSGGFEFTLSPAEDTSKTITVSGTFTNIPLTQLDPADITP